MTVDRRCTPLFVGSLYWLYMYMFTFNTSTLGTHSNKANILDLNKGTMLRG